MGFKKYILIFAHLTVFYKLGIKANDIPDVKKSCIGKYHMSDVRPNMRIKDRSYSTLQCQNCVELPQHITLDNTGTTVVINFTFNDQKQIPTITNGPLEGKGTYRFKHAYFDWLQNTPQDWEFNNVFFWVELHLVFYNIKHGDYEKALTENEGIAVFSVGFRVRPSVHRHEFEVIASGLEDIRQAYTNTSIPAFNLYSLFPPIMSEYYTYIGTITTEEIATCKTNVIWIDFEQAHKIQPEAVVMFHNLRTSFGVRLTEYTVKYTEPKTQIYRSVVKPDDALESSSGQRLLLRIKAPLFVVIWMCFNIIML